MDVWIYIESIFPNIVCVMIEHETNFHTSISCIQQGSVLCYDSCSNSTGSF